MPFGCGWVEKGGWVDLKRLLTLFRSWLQKRDLLRIETFQYDLMQIDEKDIQYKGMEADKIIFCEGCHGSRNPLFTEVTYKPVKGEILDLTIDGYHQDSVLNKSFFLLPVNGNSFRLGATYCWNPVDWNITEAGKTELTRKLAQILKTEFTVTGHQAGIRPTTHDRRPVAGLHPAISVAGILNGLGAKGCLVGPYAARAFSDLLLNRSQGIPDEINVSRYFISGK
jgi:glycine/D-amino acid oxidase-like deaminating enzyme